MHLWKKNKRLSSVCALKHNNKYTKIIYKNNCMRSTFACFLYIYICDSIKHYILHWQNISCNNAWVAVSIQHPSSTCHSFATPARKRRRLMPLKLITMLREGEQQVDLQRGNSRDQRSVCKRGDGRFSTESSHVPGNVRWNCNECGLPR